jgi:hypothetical protein
MSRDADTYPYLDALVGGWFHQDFDIDGNTLEEVLASYRDRSPPGDHLGAKADIQRFIENTPPEQLEAEFNARFMPTGFPGRDDASLHDWLRRVHALL